MAVPGVYFGDHGGDVCLDFIEGGLDVCETAAGWGCGGRGGEEADGEEGGEMHCEVICLFVS